MEKTVAGELKMCDLYKQVEAALIKNFPDNADDILGEFWLWPVAETKSMTKYGSVLLTENKDRRVLKMSSLPMSVEQYHNTLLHEVAHIIAWILAEDAGHGLAWKTMASMIGCDINISTDGKFGESVTAARNAKIKLVAECPKCGQKWFRTRRFHRNKNYRCIDCQVQIRKY
jgi:predicted SprT family Zn-dependent metalloprotease